MRYLMHTEQWVPYPTELVFRFFANPENLPRLMPRWQRTRIEEARIAPPADMPLSARRMPSIVAGNGSIIRISMRPFPFSPIRLPWEAQIEEFEWNTQFCDIQVHGPFRYWRHCHSVAPQTREGSEQEGTLIHDEVEYEMPFGFLGEFAQRFAVKYALRRTFAYRQERTLGLLARMAAAEAKLAYKPT